MTATDGQTNSSSIAPLFNKVGGSVQVISGKPAKRDLAFATSNNKVTSSLVVTAADSFTFDIDLNLQNPNVTGLGKLSFQLTAVVLDANGNTPKDPNGKPVPGIYSGNFGVGQDAQGKPQITLPGGGTASPDAKGNYEQKLTSPNGGVPLQPGNYQLRLELTMIGQAPPGQGTASVNSATATIQLH